MGAIPSEHLDRVFAALADPTRRAILERLAEGEATVSQLVAPFDLAQPTISKHLKVLEQAGLVTRGRDAQFRPVRLNPSALQQASAWLGDYRRFWEESLDNLAEYVQSLQSLEQSMQTPPAESTADREVTITRVFDAPAHLLFLAYSRPEHIKRWFGPRGWPVTLCEMDFRVGGTFRFAMTGPDGEQGTPFGGTYLEIVPNQKIRYDNGFLVEGEERMIVTITFDEVDWKTTLTVHTLFGSKAMHDFHVGHGFVIGTNSGLDQLEELAYELFQAERA